MCILCSKFEMPKDGKLQTGLQESVCAVHACMLWDAVSWISSSISALNSFGEDFTWSSPVAHFGVCARAIGRCQKAAAGLARKAPTDLENRK